MKNIYSFYNDKFGVDKRFSLFIRAVVDGGGNSIKQLEGNLLTKKETDETMMNLSECSGNDGIGFGSNVSYLEPGGFCCVAMRFGKYTIDVKGNVYKCTTNA